MNTLTGYNTKDTIVAIATFPSKAALGVIKISGPKAFHILFKIFVPKKRKDIRKVSTYTLHYGWIIDRPKTKDQRPKTRNVVDEVLISVMRAPHSYTREDVVEISCHGGIFVLNKIVALALEAGGRLAKPGEFSWRAFLNGRLDLIQVQAIADIVEAKSERALFSLSQNLSGQFSRKITLIQEDIKDIFAQLEAFLNFPEDEIEVDLAHIRNQLKNIRKDIEGFIVNSDSSRIFKEGLRCVICGKANVGKSTLFNRLLKEERVIVAKTAGTTRDVIEEAINVGGVPLRIYDTAGILEPKGLIDKEAMKRAHEQLDKADLVIFVFDYARPFNREDSLLLAKIKNKNIIFVVNKIDLKQRLNIHTPRVFKKPLVKMSALKGIGVEDLEDKISMSVHKGGLARKDNLVFLAQWQIQILKDINNSIEEALTLMKKGYSIDFLNLSLRPALEKLAQLTGEVASEEVLNKIFSNFCIGK